MVAHNVPFDRRMLAHEFETVNGDLEVLRAIDTLTISGCRLTEACARHQIPLEGAHRSLNDAMATTHLFLALAIAGTIGAPIAAPRGLARSGRVRRREDMERVVLPEPSLIVYLASRLTHPGVESATLQYLEVLGRAISDLHLDVDERAQLFGLASELGLVEAQVVQAHRRYLNDLIDAAVADNEVTDEEYDTLVRVAAALDIDQNTIETRIRPYRAQQRAITLRAGMTVVFTGEHPSYERSELQARAAAIGLVSQSNVSKTTDLVAAMDPASNSGKAAKANRYGIPIVATNDLIKAAAGATLIAHGTSSAALKVVTCPDCRATRTVPATAGAASIKRCDACTPPATRTPHSRPAQPTISW
jgi:DNA polymerase-3 subunit epsilon